MKIRKCCEIGGLLLRRVAGSGYWAGMNDLRFQALIDRTAAAHRKYHKLLAMAEREYERRYGANPSDLDDDQWIDSLHGACGAARGITVSAVAESARQCVERGLA